MTSLRTDEKSYEYDLLVSHSPTPRGRSRAIVAEIASGRLTARSGAVRVSGIMEVVVGK
ncbi:MAG: hypothetical protein ABJC63_11320 [Gemmatimonadales bacterium]